MTIVLYLGIEIFDFPILINYWIKLSHESARTCHKEKVGYFCPNLV